MTLLHLSVPIFALLNWLASVGTQPEKLDNDITMCHQTTQEFVQLAINDGFAAFHEDPLPIAYQTQGTMISYPVKDGDPANAYVVAAENSNEYLLVIHEWYGLNDYVKKESDRFAKAYGMNVMALDLYDGKVADNRDDARSYMQSVTTERALAIINGAKNFASEDASFFTVGWCFGGGWSLQTAIELGDAAKGAIMFYGMPEKNMDRLKNLKCDVLGIFASQDGWITPEVAESFEDQMKNLDATLTLKIYDAGHGFANPSNPVYDESSAKKAYQAMDEFIAARR